MTTNVCLNNIFVNQLFGFICFLFIQGLSTINILQKKLWAHLTVVIQFNKLSKSFLFISVLEIRPLSFFTGSRLRLDLKKAWLLGAVFINYLYMLRLSAPGKVFLSAQLPFNCFTGSCSLYFFYWLRLSNTDLFVLVCCRVCLGDQISKLKVEKCQVFRTILVWSKLKVWELVNDMTLRPC